METLYYNGKIYVEREVFASAILIRNGVVAKVGGSEELLVEVSEEVKKIDCKGKTVVPGFNDSHLHLAGLGESLETVDLNGSTSIDEIVSRCRDFLENNEKAKVDGVFAVGWNQDLFTSGEIRNPTRHDVDRVSKDVPVILRRVCGHQVVANTKTIEFMGLNKDSPQFEGGTFEKEEDGYPNGIFTEKATIEVKKVLKTHTKEDRKRMLLGAMEHCVSLGLTSVQSNDVGGSGIGTKEECFEILKDIYSSNKGLLRYHLQMGLSTPEEVDEYARGEMLSDFYKGDSLVTLGPLKLYKDGSLGARTAMMRDGYNDDKGNYGEERRSDEYIESMCKAADRNGIQVLTHVIGDGASESVLKTYDKLIGNSDNPLRHGLIHFQITDDKLIQRVVDKNIEIFYQPIFLDYDMHIVESRCGEKLASTSYAFNTAAEKGGYISYGSDSPVEGCNPFKGIYSAVTRMDLKGTKVYNKDESVDIYRAVDAYTIGSAHAQFMEKKKGRLKEGYYGDLVVLDRDIFEIDKAEIKDIKPLLTVVGGKVVYRSKAF